MSIYTFTKTSYASSICEIIFPSTICEFVRPSLFSNKLGSLILIDAKDCIFNASII